MKRTLAVGVCIVLGFTFVLVQPVAASPDVTLSLDGEEIQDGERVEVEGTVEVRVVAESDGELTRIEIEEGGTTSITGIGEGRSTYNSTWNVTPSVAGNSFTATAVDDSGRTSARATFKIPAESPSDIQDAINNLQNETDELSTEIDELESKKQELEEENQRLREEANQTENNTDDGEGEGMPGFTPFAFLAAFVAVGGLAVARRF